MRELTVVELDRVAGGGVAPIRPCTNVAGVVIPSMPFGCGPPGFWASGSNYIDGYGAGSDSISIQGYQDQSAADLLGASLSGGIL